MGGLDPKTLILMYHSLSENYEQFKESRITKRRFSESLWEELIHEWSQHPLFNVTEIGKTFEGRAINQVRFGIGPIHICAWSQMHGDEATATKALADIFSFLSQSEDQFDSYREILHQKISFFVIPRLNADGAERWTRETALGIDMNRDAQSLFSPEAKILSNWADTISPVFAFNLHDQNRLYSVGSSPHQTHIALLATTGDEHGTWTPSRIRAGKLANRMCKNIEGELINKIAKWSDEYNSRAFGDTFQSRGYGLLLLESGGAGWDLEKHTLRKINACLLIDALYSIAMDSWKSESLELYQQLQTNERCIVDIKLKNAPLKINQSIRADIAINLKEQIGEEGEITYSWIIEDIGDMSIYHGLTEIDASTFELINNHAIEKEVTYTQLQFKQGEKIAFQLSDFTNKIKK
jgi:hypothetical protein